MSFRSFYVLSFLAFEIIEALDTAQTERYEKFLAANKIDVAGIEFICDANGEIYKYDVNTNANYNSDAEAKAGKYGMLAFAKLLGGALEKTTVS